MSVDDQGVSGAQLRTAEDCREGSSNVSGLVSVGRAKAEPL